MDRVNKAQDWSALNEETVEEQIFNQEQKAQEQTNLVQKLMYDLVRSNPAAIEYLKDKYIDTAIAVPGDDMLTIGLRQGQANMITWIIQKAAQATSNQGE